MATKLKKTLGPIHLWGISVGLVISGDYFGWNYGWVHANFWEFFAAVSFVAIFYAVFSLSFTELAASIPHSGGPSAYAYHAFGPWGGFFAGFFTLVEFVLAPPAIASALGGYFHFLIPSINPMIASFVFFLLLISVNLLGVKQTARFELGVTLIAVCGLLFYFILTIPFFKWDNLGLDRIVISLPFANKATQTELDPAINYFHWKELFSSIPYAIWFFLAVEGVAMAAEEVKNPTRNIPIGYTAGIGTLILLAFGVLFLTAGVSSTDSVKNLSYPLSFVLGQVYGIGSWQANLFTSIGLFGLIASLMGIILGYSRQIYALASEGFLPKILAKISKKNAVPANAVLCGGAIGLVALGLGDTDQLITMAAMGACGMYVISMASFFVLRKIDPQRTRPFKVPGYPLVPGIALVMGIICLLSMITFYKELFFIMAILLIMITLFFKIKVIKNLGRIPQGSLSPEEDESPLSRGDTDF
ncbi:ethanolamine permease [Leptospira sp. GIMC2001]|uniref:ethanolamine permease n=1 Tax=Leptospira sp. GIMC2001 TaxID=1513297 RepID=UPI0023490489|nr:ethanolamine permease [Leptospira sp. GIMC2001]WCL48998.1 ethanolamine permease [Leptospira sp. GIMC2001]